MKFTGERVIPGEGDADLLNEHRARYLFAQRFSAGKTVLDVACGAGYGTALLGEKAAAVFGVDLSAEAVSHARRHYGSPKVHFAQSDCLTLPFPARQFHLVAAFEIIEHLEDPKAFLSELHRVLHPAGLLALSTPNRLYYTEERNEVNPFHVREFSFAELEEILKPLFSHRAILFENHVAGLMVSGPGAEANFREHSADCILQAAEEAEEGKDSVAGSKERKQEREKAAHFFVALCSNRPLDPARPLLYLPSTGNVLREREVHIRLLTDHLTQARAAAEQAREHVEQVTAQMVHFQQQEQKLEQLLEERTQWAWSLQQEMEQARAALQKLHQEFEERTQWAWSLQQEMEQARAALQKLHQEFEERTAWALNLDKELEQRRAELRLLYGSLWYRIGKNLRLSPIPASDQKPPQAVKPDDS
ncbi:MAG: methyltransferase domain-containing protein [Acidobacteria bacterium]|nr:methyltransferase domain-containing protein [Acidobacteriota bacterium]